MEFQSINHSSNLLCFAVSYFFTKLNFRINLRFKNISRQVIILGLISFFTDFASEMLYPVAPIFLTGALGASMAVVGLIEGFAEVFAGILKGYFGHLSDKIGKRSIFVVLGYGLSSIIKPLPGFLPNVLTVGLSRGLDRVGKGIRTSPRDALLAANANGNSGAVFGFHRSFDTFGAVAGPLAALTILYFVPGEYTYVYFAALIPSIFAIYFTFLVKDPLNISPVSKKKFYKEFWKNAPKEYKSLLIIITIFSFVNSSDVFLILKSRDISQSDTTAILGYVFYNFIYAFGSYPAGILSDKFGKKTIFTIGLLIFSLVYFGFAFSESMILIWFLFAFYGIYAAATEGITKAWVSDLIPDHFSGTAIGLLNMLSSFAIMLGSILAGVLWDQFGSSVPFFLSAIVSLIIGAFLITKK